jgi:protein TonB
MAFEAFVAREQVSRHRRRLTVSSLASAGLLGGALLVAASASRGEASSKAPAETLEEVLDVKLVAKPEPPPPAAPPAPAPAALVPRTVKINPNAPPPKPLEAPKEIPKEKPKEADASQDKGVAGVHEGGDTAGVGTGVAGAGKAAPAPVPTPAPTPSAPPPPPPPKVVTISEDTEPPVPISQTRPKPPADFVAAGEDAVVVVKFEVTEGGDVSNVRIVKGHPLLDAVVLAAVRGWKFKPAMSQGRPVAYPKTVKIPFRIRT